MKNKIIIISGDPNSINSEVIYKTWKKINNSIKKKIYLISNYNLIKQQLRKLNYNVRLEKVKDINDKTNSTNLKIIDVFLNFAFRARKHSKRCQNLFECFLRLLDMFKLSINKLFLQLKYLIALKGK